MRIESKYKIDTESGCWNWIASITNVGYGQLWYQGKMHAAHRLLYTLYKGRIPIGLDLDHRCRNRKCVNPEHLEAVTRSENVRRSNHFKVTDAQVAEIRLRMARGERQKDVASLFGITRRYVYDITHNRMRG